MGTSLEEAVKVNGFKDEKEFHSLVAEVDIRTCEKLADFKKWQYKDGTKKGILKLARM